MTQHAAASSPYKGMCVERCELQTHSLQTPTQSGHTPITFHYIQGMENYEDKFCGHRKMSLADVSIESAHSLHISDNYCRVNQVISTEKI